MDLSSGQADGRCAAILVAEGADASAKWRNGALEGATPVQTAFAGGLLEPAKVIKFSLRELTWEPHTRHL